MEEKKKKTYRNFTRSEKAIIRAYVELMQKKGEYYKLYRMQSEALKQVGIAEDSDGGPAGEEEGGGDDE